MFVTNLFSTFFSGISEGTEHPSFRVMDIQVTQVISQGTSQNCSAHVLFLLYYVAQGW